MYHDYVKNIKKLLRKTKRYCHFLENKYNTYTFNFKRKDVLYLNTKNTKEINSPLLQKERDYLYDNAKAFLIISVVVGHLANGIFSTSTDWVVALQKFIYVFHMPVFMIISGRFAKRRIDNNDWVTVINKIVIPYIVLQTMMLLLCSAMEYGNTSTFSYFKPLFGLWYFFTIAIYSFISPYIVKYKWTLPLSFIVGLGVGFLPHVFFGGFHRIFCFYPFFLLGYYTHHYNFEFCKKIWFRIISVAAFVTIGLYVLNNNRDISFELLCMNKVYSFIAKDVDVSIIDAFVQNIFRYIIGILFFFFTLGITPSKKTFYSYIGTNSSYVYALHLFFIVFLRAVDERYDILRILTNNWLLLTYCLAGIPLAFILASKPVRKIARPFVEPKFELRKIMAQLQKNN